MVASNKTVDAILDVLRLHLTDEQIGAVMHDLSAVRGNKSFEDTMEILNDKWKQRNGHR